MPEKYFIDFNLVTFYKPDINKRILDTYRLGYIGTPGQGRKVYSIKGCTPTVGSSAHGILEITECYLINGRIRTLTPLEAKRVMGFPEDFILPAKDDTAIKLLGNSVTIPVLMWITEQMIDTGIFEGSLLRTPKYLFLYMDKLIFSLTSS